jgi:uncharacterized protein
MIKRDLAVSLLKDSLKSPVIAILGPRQSGKTTLARNTFKRHIYISLEDLDIRDFAKRDPRKFLADNQSEHGIILDEIQRVPELLSYIQTQVDLEYKPGYFILTGSQNFLVTQAITQSLAGRISLHTLLALSVHELDEAKLLPSTLEEMLFKGSYPIIYGRNYDPSEWYVDYVRTYLERDVRTITAVSDLSTFRRFMKLCAGRIGQIINLTSLGNDCGITYNTAKAWLSILEASYIIFILQPHHKNFSKRLIKSPKLFFYDTGLASALLDIESEKQLNFHYLRGGLFESLVISELYKSFYNADKVPHLYFWRDKTGHEVDCIIERGQYLFPVEVKAGLTITPDYFEGLNYWNNFARIDPNKGFVVYGGTQNQSRSLGNIVSWRNISSIFERTKTDRK